MLNILWKATKESQTLNRVAPWLFAAVFIVAVLVLQWHDSVNLIFQSRGSSLGLHFTLNTNLS
jgi:hypothetical protein